MEKFYIGDRFFNDIGDYVEFLGLDEEEIENLPNDWEEEIELSEKKPFCQIDSTYLYEKLMEDFIDNEDIVNDTTFEKNLKILLGSYIDFKSLNEKMLPLYFPTNKKYTLKKEDLKGY